MTTQSHVHSGFENYLNNLTRQTLCLTDQRYAPLVRRWIMRIIVRMGAHKQLLLRDYIRDDSVLLVVGLEHLLVQEADGQYRQREAQREVFAHLERLEAERIEVPTNCPLETNLTWLANRLGISEIDLQILRFVILADDCDTLDLVLNRMGSLSLHTIQLMFADTLELPIAAVADALRPNGKLATCGIMAVDLECGSSFLEKLELLRRLPDQLFNAHSDPMLMIRERVVPGLPAKLSESHYAHISDDLALIQNYLEASRERAGVNILIYGPPGTGKTELVRTIAHAAGRPLYEVATQENDTTPLTGQQRLKACRLAQNMLWNEAGALILFDEIEDVFSHGEAAKLSAHRNAAGKKAWMNQLLENNPVPTFWLSNAIGDIDRAILRRFDLVLHLDYPGRQARAEMVRTYFGAQNVSEQWITNLAECENLAPAVIERTARVTACLGVGANIEDAATRIMRGTLGAMDLRLPPRTTKPVEMPYRLDCINTDTPVDSLAERLTTVGQGRLCLYGPSGTGKTAFGHFLARQLGKRLLVKRASDLLSPLVGMAEKHMAEMFTEALDEDAVLLLDEADSFLQDRGRAAQSWEITQVNEMLTQLEAFEGTFIASTNFMDTIDSATLRRFDLKVRFDWLHPHQIETLLDLLLANLGLHAEPHERQQIGRLTCLAPGDFANIQRQSRLRSFGTVTEIHDALLAESRMKSGRHGSVRIGF